MTANAETVRQAVGGIPEGQWTDQSGQLWTTQQILDQWDAQQLDQPAEISEDTLGNPVVRTIGTDGRPGDTILTLTQGAGTDIPDVPVVEPTNYGY